MEGRRLFEVLYSVDSVKTTRKKTSHFHILLLILTHRHFVRLMHEYIRRHETRVCQQTGINVIGLFAHFLLERRNAL